MLRFQAVGAAPRARRRSQLWPPPGAGAHCASALGGRPPREAVCIDPPPPDELPLLSAIGRRRARMMEYSVGRGVACCGLLCFHVGEFGDILHSSCFREIRQVSVVPRPVDYASNERHVVVRFSCGNT
jgi:hypothetical protein